MRRRVCVVALAAGLILGIGMLAMGGRNVAANAPQKTSTADVKIDNFSFDPVALTVPMGTTVTWTNRDDIPHTVVNTDDPKAFKSKALDTDDKFSFTFTKAGTYPYFCSMHPKMTAKIIVQ